MFYIGHKLLCAYCLHNTYVNGADVQYDMYTILYRNSTTRESEREKENHHYDRKRERYNRPTLREINR